ncbi:MAG: metal ABC transporter permease [Verrucomicrobia bacterium]|nr:metal ABC transporter permease [Verrucomicrobiota bacterium]
MIALLDGPFIRMALVGGLLFCLVASILSPWVVLRRLSYATDALAHATFGGIALALFFGMQGVVDNAGSGKVLLISLAFSLLVSQLLALLMRQSFLSQDAATGIVYAGAFAFGGIFLAIRRDDIPNHHGLESLLFGNIFLLEPLELWILGVISLLALACAWFWRRDMMLWAFDSDIAMAEGCAPGCCISHSWGLWLL